MIKYEFWYSKTRTTRRIKWRNDTEHFSTMRVEVPGNEVNKADSDNNTADGQLFMLFRSHYLLHSQN